MAHIFAITSSTDTLPLDKGRGNISFTVTNTTSRPLRGRAVPVPLGNTKKEWLTLGGEAERDFSSSGTHQYRIEFVAPEGTPAGKYPFRLDVLSVVNPDEDFTEGPAVTAEIEATPAPAPPSKFPKWIIPVVLLVLLVGGVLTWLALRKIPPPNVEVAATPTPTPPTPTPTPAIVDLSGTWNNKSAADAAITKLQIRQTGNRVSANAVVKCPPSTCDLGTADGIIENDKVKLSWSANLIRLTASLSSTSEGLLAVSDTDYLPNGIGPPHRVHKVELFRSSTLVDEDGIANPEVLRSQPRAFGTPTP
jgi:hypothetical protein